MRLTTTNGFKTVTVREREKERVREKEREIMYLNMSSSCLTRRGDIWRYTYEMDGCLRREIEDKVLGLDCLNDESISISWEVG